MDYIISMKIVLDNVANVYLIVFNVKCQIFAKGVYKNIFLKTIDVSHIVVLVIFNNLIIVGNAKINVYHAIIFLHVFNAFLIIGLNNLIV